MSVPRNTLEAELKESKRRLPRAVPVQEKERIQLVDIIRGFAVFGILVANMVAFSGQHGGVMTWESWPDRAVVFLTEFLVRAKFYTLFSFLFGWGMSIQLQRAKERGAKFLPVYLRRLIVLLAFGLIHGLFIWSGDILTFYALSGFFLILFRKRSTKLVLTTAVLLLVFNVFLNSPLESAESLRTWYAEATASLRWNIHPESNFQDGTYLEINGRRIQEFVSTNSFMLYFFGPVFSMFLLGMVWGRRGYFRNYLEHKPFFKRLLWIALPLGLLLNGLFASTRVWNDLGWPELISPEYFRIFVVGTRTFGAPLLMLAYVSAFSLLISQPKWGSRFASLAPIGRIALTSYLVQSVVATLIFYNYVWSGLYGEVGPAFSLVITLIIYTSQMRFSKWWLERYQFGPVEWLWRTLSYRQRPPYRHGDTYDTMHPSRWVRRLQEISPGRLLGAVWALLIIWAVILFNAYSELGGPGRAITLGGESPAASATPIPGASIPGQEDPSSSSPEVVVTPDVDPVRYDPGPLAAAGDTLALAQQFDHQVALTHIEALTGAPSFGRYAGTPQGYAAGDYIAEQFAAYGLQPAGEDGTFFQPFPLAFHNLASIPRLVVTDADGASHADYQLHDDYSVIGTAYLGAGAAAGQVFWANNCEPSDFYDVDAAGKIVLCRALSSVESGRYALEHGAAGLLLLTNTDTFPLAFGATYRENWLQETIPALRVSRAVVDDILRGSGLTVDELSLRFDSFDLPAQVQIEVDLSGEEACAAQPCRGRNVLGVIPGRHPDYRDEVVIIGGHYDHLGQSPGGAITWPGANDNASGVAVMLEVARMWQAQGYVPNRTVVFAAWDAEELALLGSRFYVDNPQYPLDKTVFVLNLDMVGAGNPLLAVDGSSGFESYLQDVASQFGVQTMIRDYGSSDHAAFAEVGVPANMLIWDWAGLDLQYHRPGDTTTVIMPERIQEVGQITSLALLGLSEGAADIQSVVAARAQAVLDGDLDAFLSTSSSAWQGNDRLWFEDVQSYQPLEFDLQMDGLVVVAGRASANVSIRLAYPDEDGSVPEGGGPPRSILTARIPAQFIKEGGGWKWGGADLVAVTLPEPQDGEEPPNDLPHAFDVFVSSSVDYLAREQDEEDPPEYPLTALGEMAAGRYAELADLLGLPQEIPASILLYPDLASLRADTALSAAANASLWVQPGVIKLVYSEDIFANSEFQDALVWLFLSEAGIEPQAAPWLWDGLSIALTAASNPQGVQARYLPNLMAEMAGEATSVSLASDWAAIEYLRQRSGWNGLGRFIVELGRLCRQNGCTDEAALDSALRRQYGNGAAVFENLWQEYWSNRIASAQADLDAVLAARVSAVRQRDRSAFLATVDRGAGNLMAEQLHWFDTLEGSPPASYEMRSEIVAIFDNGDVLADVRSDFNMEEGSAAQNTDQRVLFTPRSGRLLWAGESLEILRGVRVDVSYPAGMEDLAAGIRDQAEEITLHAVDLLDTRLPFRLQIKLYRSPADFRSSISLAFPDVDWVDGWTGEGASVKLLVSDFNSADEYHPTLATYISRQLLHQMGVSSPWLLQGTAAYLAADLGNPHLNQAAVGNLWRVAYRAEDETLPELTDLPLEYAYEDRREWAIGTSYAWDVLRYIALVYGEDSMWNLIRLHSGGQSVGTAVLNALGTPMNELLPAWRQSLARAHVDERWIELVGLYDVTRVEDQIDILSAPDLEGRQAGSPGAQWTAEYIASQFEQYGLLPIVPLPPSVEVSAEGEQPQDGEPEGESLPESEGELLSYLQYFPIQYTTLQWTPSLTFSQPDGAPIDSFTFRSDFGLALNASPGGGIAEGEMVWILDAYDGMQLRGKIAVRRSEQPIEVELSAALEHGAAGLILIKDREIQRERDLMAKEPMPLAFPEQAAIPVVVLGVDGFTRFQEVTGLTPIDLSNSPPALPLGVHARIEIPLSEPQAGQSANVLGFLPGSDPAFQDEIIIVGAHYDHVGDDPDTLICSGEAVSLDNFDERTCSRLEGYQYSGRNDNASGVAIMLEVLRMWHESGYQPKRSVLFAAWGAQEAGQAGSQYYVENAPLALEDTVAMVQLDSVAGGRGYYLLAQGIWDTEGLMLFGADTANNIYDGRLTIAKESVVSDHWTFQALGIPALLLSWDEAADALNWPDVMADEVEPYRLNIAGQLFSLMLMSLAY